MLISRIVQPDAQSTEFARRHAASRPSAADQRGGFADYLAATLHPSQPSSPEGTIRRPESSQRGEATGAGARDPGGIATDDARSREAAAAKDPGVPDERAERTETAGGARPVDDAPDAAAAEHGRQPSESRSPTRREDDTGHEPDGKIAIAASDAKRSGKADAGRPVTVKGEAEPEAQSSDARPGAKARRVSEKVFEIDVTVAAETAASDAANVAREASEVNEAKKLAAAGEDGAGDRAAAEARVHEDATRKAAAAKSASVKSVASATPQGGEPVGMPASARRASNRTPGDDAKREAEDSRAAGRVEVRDLRGARRTDGQSAGGDERAGRDGVDHGTTADTPKPEVAREGGTGSAGNQFDPSRGEAPLPPSAARGSEAPLRAAANQAAALRQSLQEQVNGEIVRSARLIVRGSDSGEIRLNLKPEHLGTVRITLQMQDGHIAGRIIVDNQSVREVFEQNLASLQRAFQESGLEAGGVEISLADTGGRAQDDGERAARKTSARDAANRFGLSVPELNLIDDYHDLVDVTV